MDSIRVRKLHVLVFWLSAALSGTFQKNTIQNISLGFVRRRNHVCKNRISNFMLQKNGVHSDVGKEDILSPLESDRMQGTSLGFTSCRPCMRLRRLVVSLSSRWPGFYSSEYNGISGRQSDKGVGFLPSTVFPSHIIPTVGTYACFL